jgi:hypothetical protein
MHAEKQVWPFIFIAIFRTGNLPPSKKSLNNSSHNPVLEFLNNLWWLGTE